MTNVNLGVGPLDLHSRDPEELDNWYAEFNSYCKFAKHDKSEDELNAFNYFVGTDTLKFLRNLPNYDTNLAI